mmetsp:Transcript_7430/g.10295  ORF Transcript_7430/g.10295 Transcript_7430/m.10295 type:complete len:121 (+) Transcript_7430:1067-1429(+)
MNKSLSAVDKASPIYQRRVVDEIKEEEYWQEMQLILDSSPKGWRALGGVMKFSSQQLNAIERETKPTKKLLEQWVDRKEATLFNFIEHLEKIEQWTLIHKIAEWVQYAQPQNENPDPKHS